eukprot:CAMPEP_0174821978 /NCGR_PEP_ID=MMETSP1107-20130205/11936_1 /TAXON_ID=36770 /ORGANISM="Paraphysomonas vestita, Strain GFlagA" /LENGTH=974 /DNA_ID=CAMNT_0016039717 /DNA_START=170 /DNA_END=3095 /DNA_ORIENTATION=-
MAIMVGNFGYYKPDINKAKGLTNDQKFVMVIPPPNVTGSLHLGHALTSTIEDTLTRWYRMRGYVALWVPGVDHAGIATQSVVEKRLMKDNKLTRHDLGRENFVKKVWEWKETYGSRICQQERLLAASVDWSRETFTMDPKCCRAVTEAFVRFYEDGLIYRDTRLINWSCALQSAISEIEVDYVDLEGITYLRVPNHTKKEKYEFGTLTSFAYKVVDSETDEEIVVATTRLETMLGDTAVAIHPKDPRYTHLHGKFLQHPFLDRKIPIITDDVLVDMNFGTGAVKVTPAHDPNDNACGKRNNLDTIIIFTGDGKISDNCGEFSGMMRYDARSSVENALKEKGLFRGKEPNKMRLGLCSRSGDIIEPMITPQWYVNCNTMAANAVAAVRNGELKILPEFHEATWYRWLENIRDWCISRQLWWGHRIPAYFARTSQELSLDKNDPANNSRWVVARTEEEARTKAAQLLNVTENDVILDQDEDVLDTWFSSGLFPFSVFGWPEETEDFKAFYPTTLLETGCDILFFWVARMVMMGMHLTGKLPFTTVYLHAMVRDKYGRKMSKSLGNVIDPQEVISGCDLDTLIRKIEEGNLPPSEVKKATEGQKLDFPDGIPECGADALRFGMLAYTVQGRDVNLDIKRVVGYRQFCNKLWNAVRFAVTYLTDFTPWSNMRNEIVTNPFVSSRDLYILSKLNTLTADCNRYLETYVFGAVASALHSFFIYEFCDVYLELIKPVVGYASQTSDSEQDNTKRETKRVAQMTLYTCLEQYLRLTHPLMPFVTEELWQRLPNRELLDSTPTIMLSNYPTAESSWFNPEKEEDMTIVTSAIHAASSLRSHYRIPNHVKPSFYFRSTSNEVIRALTSQGNDFCTLGRSNSLIRHPEEDNIPAGWCVKVVSENLSLLLDLNGVIDCKEEIKRLEKEVDRITPQIEQYRKKINIPGYEEKVPENVRILNQEKLTAYESELKTTLEALEGLKAIAN